MDELSLLLKTYKKDLQHARTMIDSFNRHNAEGLKLYVVAPDEEFNNFAQMNSENVSVLGESLFEKHLVTESIKELPAGYINQEIVKLSFWELGLSVNYFCADSDLVFIRDFRIDDFMFSQEIPYSVLVEDRELRVEPRYFKEHWQGREVALRDIQRALEIKDPRMLTCHGHQIFSSKVLSSLAVDFMAPRQYSYADLLRIAPYEFSWYNFWLQKSKVIEIAMREPLVKTFHHEGHLMEYAIRGISTSDIARSYIGIVVNSNFSDSYQSPREPEKLEKTLARYVQPRFLAKALWIQVRLRLKSHFTRQQ